MNWLDTIAGIARRFFEETGIPIETSSFSLEECPLQTKVLYLGEVIAVLETVDDRLVLEDSILGAIDRIRQLSVNARMNSMGERLHELSCAVIEELRLKAVHNEILDSISFAVEDMGYSPRHYETDKEQRGYPDIALTASWDIIRVSHVLDYDVEPPMDAFAMATEFVRQLLEYA